MRGGASPPMMKKMRFSETKPMPSYDFKNKKTGEIIEVRMSMNDLDKYKEDNPDMERYFGNQAPATMYGKPKQSDGFKEVMSKIQQDHPRANLSNYT